MRKVLIVLFIILAIIALFLLIRKCTEVVPPTPTKTPTVVITTKVPTPTKTLKPTAVPPTFTPTSKPTKTVTPTRTPKPTLTPKPTQIKSCRHWNEYFQVYLDVCRYMWPGLVTNHALVGKQSR